MSGESMPKAVIVQVAYPIPKMHVYNFETAFFGSLDFDILIAEREIKLHCVTVTIIIGE